MGPLWEGPGHASKTPGLATCFAFFKSDSQPWPGNLFPWEGLKLGLVPDLEKQNITTTFWALVAEPRTLIQTTCENQKIPDLSSRVSVSVQPPSVNLRKSF